MSFLHKLILCLCLTTSLADDISQQGRSDSKILDHRDCRRKGFDPIRLACPTCDLLPEIVQDACKGCCQSYLDSKRRTNPYEAAVLVKSSYDLLEKLGHPASQFSTEIDVMLDDKEEWEKLLKEKGGKERIQVMTRNMDQNDSSSQHDIMALLMRRRPSVEVLLLDEKIPSGPLVYDTLRTKATEIISLQGLSKDDIKDLLMTLLP